MGRNVLMESSEEENFELIQETIRVDGRNRSVDAILNDSIDVGDGDILEGSRYTESDDDNGSDDDTVDSDDSDDGSVEIVPILTADRVRMHDPVIHDSYHCPPFDDLTHTFSGAICEECDCDDFNFARCLQETNYLLLRESVSTIDFEEQLLLDGVDIHSRVPNNEMRKFYYKKLFVCLDFGVLRERGYQIALWRRCDKYFPVRVDIISDSRNFLLILGKINITPVLLASQILVSNSICINIEHYGQ